MSRALGATIRNMNSEQRATQLGPAFCKESRNLLDAFGETVQELFLLHEQQFHAIVGGDLNSDRFDLLIHMANEKKYEAKYAYLRHLEAHGCSTSDATDQS